MNKNEKVGGLRERIRLERAVEVRTASGSVTMTWSLLKEVWGAVKYRTLRSDEDMIDDKKTAVGATTFRIRRYDGLREKDRAVYRDEVYDIIAVTETPDREFMEFTAEKRI